MPRKNPSKITFRVHEKNTIKLVAKNIIHRNYVLGYLNIGTFIDYYV